MGSEELVAEGEKSAKGGNWEKVHFVTGPHQVTWTWLFRQLL